MLTLYSDNSRRIEIDGGKAIWSLVFLEDGKHLLSGGEDGLIRQWYVEDGTTVGETIRARTGVEAIVLSNDRKWIVSGEHKWATVWNRNTRQRVLTVAEHTSWVLTVDVSPDSTRFATGAMDKKVFIWDILTGRRVIGPLEHADNPTSVKFSPDGDRIATATWNCEVLQIYHAHTGQWLRTVPVATCSTNPIAWSSDSQRIFALSTNGVLRQTSVNTGAFLSEWTVPGGTDNSFVSIALASNDKFIACFVGHSLSFWDASTGAQLGTVLDHPGGRLNSIALSSDNNYVATGSEDGIITVRKLNNILPMSYLGGQRVVQQSQPGCCADLQWQVDALHDDVGTFLGTLSCVRLNTNPNQTS